MESGTTLTYAAFLFLPVLSSNYALIDFRTLHRKTLKYALGIRKSTWDENIWLHVLIPTVE